MTASPEEVRLAWDPTIEGHEGPRYVAIADAIGEAVASGALAPGARLPTHRELASVLGVTVGTVTRGYAEASRRGITVGEVGRGTFVRAPEPALGQWMRLGTAPPPGGAIDLSQSVMLCEDLDEGAVLARALREVAEHVELGPLVSDYSVSGDPPHHREAAARWLRLRLPEVAARDVTFVAGAQHGILVALGALTRPGDVVLTEAMTYPGFKAAAHLLGVRLVGLPMDEHGVLPDALDAALRTHAPAAVYLVPTIHNPTTVTSPPERRAALVDVLRGSEAVLVEDDAHGWLDPDGPPPLAAAMPERAVLLATLSKLLAPGLRTGFVVAPRAFRSRLRAAVRGSVWMTPPVMAEVATRWLVDGTAESFVEHRRRAARERVALALEALDGHVVWANPHGYYIWLHLPEPWRREDFVHAAAQRGVQIVGAEAFAVGRDRLPHAVRICLGSVRERSRLQRALAILAALLDGDADTDVAVV